MAPSKTLSAGDRQFFHYLSEAAATNPFSDAYIELQGKIAGCDSDTGPDRRLRLMIERVSDRIRELERTDSANMNCFAGADRELLGRAFLFDIYHRYLPSFDRLMGEQVAAGAQSIPVPFAREVLGLLVQRGFPTEDARRFFAIFYQLCRAFYFIDRGLVGRSESMKQLRRHLWNNVFTNDIRVYDRHLWNRMEDFSTVLLGNTGTGKGAAAAAIGQSGFIPFDERKGAFVESFVTTFKALNLSQFPESLIESELFGHRKGSFTGAVEAHEGIFARCSSHGAIFLDEVGDVSVPVQIKLLHVLQERTFSPVGSHEKIRFHGRIIAATNKPLDTLRSAGLFRDDFFYRLCSDLIMVPSLQQRIAEEPAEVDDLVELIICRITGQASPEIATMVRRAIDTSPGRGYSWPGNVRELEQAVRRILLTGFYGGDESAIGPDLCRRLQSGIEGGSLDAAELLSGYCTLLYGRHGTYEEAARRANLDRRTVKAYVTKHQKTTIQH